MGVSVDTGGGRGKVLNFDLNLVPFIDLLSTCITFLLATAVWVQVTTLQVDQAIGNIDGLDAEVVDKPPPLTVHLRGDGLWLGRALTETHTPGGALVPAGVDLPRTEVGLDWDAVSAELAADRGRWPAERAVVLNTDDGVPYGDAIHALDLVKGQGYDQPLLAGGPAAPVDGALPPR